MNNSDGSGFDIRYNERSSTGLTHESSETVFFPKDALQPTNLVKSPVSLVLRKS